MDDVFARVWEQLTNRVTGPMMIRFVLQPCMAVILAVRAGLADARAGRPPYLATAWTDRAARAALLHSGWRDVGLVFGLACALDTIYQVVVLKSFHPLQALFVGCVLAIVPYVLVRGPMTRLARRSSR